MTGKQRKGGRTVTSAVIEERAEAPPGELVTVDTAARLAGGRTREEFLRLRDQRSYARGFPARTWIDGHDYCDRAEVLAWAVEVGCCTAEGEPLLDYDGIGRLLNVSRMTVKDWERDRKANVRTYGTPDVDDIPDPYDTYWPPASPRPMWRRDAILQWAIRTGRMTADGVPLVKKTGRWKRQYRPRQ